MPFFIYLRIDRGGANGFCIQPGQILHGGIDIDSLGLRLPHGAVFLEWIDNPPDCYPGNGTEDCMVTEQFYPPYLEEPQVAEMERLMNALPEDRCEPDPWLLCDPCIITTLEIARPDLSVYSDHCCGTQLSPGYHEAFDALMQFVEALAAQGG